jgi:hypothetical protein
MDLVLLPKEEWEVASSQLAKTLNLSEDFPKVRLHADLSEAVFETCLALSQLHSHKKAIAVIKGNSPIFDVVIPWYLKEAYQVQITSWDKLKDEQTQNDWFAGLKKDTAFVLFAEDHAVTAEVTFWEQIQHQCEQLKIPSLCVSHFSFMKHRGSNQPALAAKICRISDSLAFSVLGSRLHLGALVSHLKRWQIDKIMKELNIFLQQKEEQEQVIKFENLLSAHKYFKANEIRYFDRSVLEFKHVSADAMIKGIGHANLQTPNLCSWNSMGKNLLSWWAESDDVSRSLIVIPQGQATEKLAHELSRQYQKILALQTWSV